MGQGAQSRFRRLNLAERRARNRRSLSLVASSALARSSGRFCRGSDAAEQIGTRGMQQVIAAEIAGCGERIDNRERRLRAVHLGNRHRPV